MKGILAAILSLSLFFSSGGCGGSGPVPDDMRSGTIPITLTVGDETFAAILSDNQTTRELIKTFPLTLKLSEMNGNEKYADLEEGLPTDTETPGQIRRGDLMLYGNDCIVLFYEAFSSSYDYTRLGRVENPDGLAEALGAGEITVTFAAE